MNATRRLPQRDARRAVTSDRHPAATRDW